MASSKQQSGSLVRCASKLAKTLAPEEICAGDYVARLYEIKEFPSWFWEDGICPDREELVRIQYTPEDGGIPLKVKSVCLPFVLVKDPRAQRFTLDVRQVKLARLDREFAKMAWNMLRAPRTKRKRK